MTFRPRRLRSASRTAFTMLELILATAMMSVLALTLYQCLRIAYRARDTANAAVGPARSAEIAVGMVRREMENALPPKGVLAGPFIGELGVESAGASGVQFYAIGQTPRQYRPAPGGNGGNLSRTSSGTSGSSRSKGRSGSSGGRSGTSAGWGGGRGDPTLYGGVHRVELVVTPATDGSGGANLVRRVTRNLLASTEALPDDEVLCRHVTEFTVRYYDGYQWAETWDSTQLGDTLPMAVEVALAVDAPPGSPAAKAAEAMAARGGVAPAYRASRIFFLPCRDETALMQGATQ
jgi:hypothetical protein